MLRPSLLRCLRPLLLLAAATTLASRAGAQLVYSIDWQGPTVSRPASGSLIPITEADILISPSGAPAYGPLPAPGIRVLAPFLSLSKYNECFGHQPGTPCGLELDALSDGRDAEFLPSSLGPIDSLRVWYSVDEYSAGTFAPTPGHAEIVTEQPVGDVSSDVFVDTGLPPPPLAPFAVVPHSAGAIDGDGLPSLSGFVYPGVGLIEPNPPTFVLPNPGDNLDALDIGNWSSFPSGGVYFSLDNAIIDPVLNIPNSNSAAAEGKRGADVLRVATPGSTIQTFAQANQLGLDLLGPNSDDLDALALAENGDGIYQPSQVPYDWVGSATAGSGSDMLLFSVRRGSAVIGMPDSIFGLPISPGDVLTTPLPFAQGGLSPFPGIFIAAENLQLGSLERGSDPGPIGDDLDALEVEVVPCFDCNHNGVEDAVDIATGTSVDMNSNGIPDECEQLTMPYCFCTAGLGPCGNDDADAGCKNSTAEGAKMTAGGSTSVMADDLGMDVVDLPPNKSLLLFMGTQATTPEPFKDGLRCTYGTVWRFSPQTSSSSGTASHGPGIVGIANANFPPGGQIAAGSTWAFQTWYRNPTGPCGQGSNLSNAIQATFVP